MWDKKKVGRCKLRIQNINYKMEKKKKRKPSRDLIHCMVKNNVIIYLKVAKTVNPKCSQYVKLWRDVLTNLIVLIISQIKLTAICYTVYLK